MEKHKETREEKADRFKRESGKEFNASDCSTSIAPAEEPGPCDCDADDPAIGWINVVIGWARRPQLEAKAVISALGHAKDFVIDYKSRILELEQQLNKFQNTIWSEQADVQEAVLQKFDVRNKMAQLERQLEERDAEVSEWKSKYEGAKIAFNSACNAEKNILAEGRKAGLEEAAIVAETEMHQWDSMEADMATALVTAIRALSNSETEKKG